MPRKTSPLAPGAIITLALSSLLITTTALGGPPRRGTLKGRGMSLARPKTAALINGADWRAFMKKLYPARAYNTGLPNTRAQVGFFSPTGSLYQGRKKVLSYTMTVSDATVHDRDLIIEHSTRSISTRRGIVLDLKDMSRDHAYVIQCPVQIKRRAHNAFVQVRPGVIDFRGRHHQLPGSILGKNTTSEHVTIAFDPSKDNITGISVYRAKIALSFIVASRVPASLYMDAINTCTIRALRRTSP